MSWSVRAAEIGKALVRRVQHGNQEGLWVPAIAGSVVLYYQLAAPLLDFARHHTSRILPEAFYFTQLVFRPQPYVIPVYLAGYLIIPLLAFGVVSGCRWLLEHEYLTPAFVKRWPMGLFASVLLFLLYTIALHLFALQLWRQIRPQGDLKIQALTVAALLIALWWYHRRYGVASFIARLERLPWQKIRWWVLLFVLLFIFSPNFPIDLDHYNDHLGPVNDLLHGKQFLFDTSSPYGLLNTYFLYAIFRFLIPISYHALSAVLAAAFMLWSLGWYYLVRQWLRSEVLAVGVVLAIVIFFNIPLAHFDFAYGPPAHTPFHQLMFLALAWLWWRYRTRVAVRSRTENPILLATAVGFFWFVDTGMYLVFATLGVFFFLALFQDQPLRERVRSFLWQVTKLIGGIVGLAFSYSVTQYLRWGRWPQWSLLYEASSVYRKGYQLIDLPSHGLYYVYIFVFIVSLGYIVGQAYQHRKTDELLMPLFIVLFGVSQFFYYLVRPHTFNLAPRMSIFLIVLVAWWCHVFLTAQRRSPELYRAFSAILVGVATMAVFYGGARVWWTLSARNYATIRQNYFAEIVGRREVYGGYTEILSDIAILKKDYAGIQRPALVHWYDGKILLDLNKTNFLPMMNLQSVFLKPQLEKVIAKTRLEKPSYLFVGRVGSPGFRPFAQYTDKIAYFLGGVGDLYTVDRHLSTLDVLRLKDLVVQTR
ncbi:hypothetical protein HYW67_04285 [Candidatus Parcubacteria bacterium]|nr:hypothetical protein [Candidatus Parcubacteria bacterium]